MCAGEPRFAEDAGLQTVNLVVLVWIANAFNRGLEYSLGRMKNMRGNTRQLLTTLTRTSRSAAASSRPATKALRSATESQSDQISSN